MSTLPYGYFKYGIFNEFKNYLNNKIKGISMIKVMFCIRSLLLDKIFIRELLIKKWTNRNTYNTC